MTSEIVVMNREGVALAADSVITYQGSKMFNTANKLFMLAPTYPVGILVYNNAMFMGLPWEIIIKAYRDFIHRKGIYYESLEEYATDFINFIINERETFVTLQQEEQEVFGMVDSLFKNFRQDIYFKIEDFVIKKTCKVPESKVAEFTKETIDKFYDNIGRLENVFSDEETEEFKSDFIDKFGDKIQEIKTSYFDHLPLDKEDHSKLESLCFFMHSKILPANIYTGSGIVFAGYGGKEVLPSCASYFIQGMLCERLHYRKDFSYRINFSDASACIVPFAQKDIIATFIEGRHHTYTEALIKELEPRFSDDELDQILTNVLEEVETRYTSSIMAAVNALPKEDLALMAETMVSLTSFMRKVSMGQETVGGPVDVAVISKKDGFVWINRKQYFDIEKNLHFGLNYKKGE